MLDTSSFERLVDSSGRYAMVSMPHEDAARATQSASDEPNAVPVTERLTGDPI